MKYLIIIYCLFVSKIALSTNQVSDILLWNNDTFNLYESPLESNNELSDKILQYNNTWSSSGCHRGFIATWIIIDDQLFLQRMINYKDGSDINFMAEEILGQKFKGGRMQVASITGDLWCGLGANMWYLPVPVYETEYKITVSSGKIIEYEKFTATNCKYQLRSDALDNFIYSNTNWSLVNDIGLEQSSFYISAETDSNGAVLRCEVVGWNKSRINQRLFDEAARVIRTIPCLKVYSHEGVVYRHIVIKILLNTENMNKYKP